MKKVLIVGGGKVGTHLASVLITWSHQVKLIEMRHELIPRLMQALSVDVVVARSGTDPNVLESAGISRQMLSQR